MLATHSPRLEPFKETNATSAALGQYCFGHGGTAAARGSPDRRRGSKQISVHKDWAVYEVTDNRGRICYIASEPKEQSGNYSRRDPPALLVARLPGNPPTEG